MLTAIGRNELIKKIQERLIYIPDDVKGLDDMCMYLRAQKDAQKDIVSIIKNFESHQGG